MKFALVAVLTAFAGNTMAFPAASGPAGQALQARGDGTVPDIGAIVDQIRENLPIIPPALDDALNELEHTLDDIQKRLEDIIGDKLPALEEKLGKPLMEYLVDLLNDGFGPAVVEAVANAVAQLADGVPLAEVNKNLNKATNGAIKDLEKALKIDNIKEVLGL